MHGETGRSHSFPTTILQPRWDRVVSIRIKQSRAAMTRRRDWKRGVRRKAEFIATSLAKRSWLPRRSTTPGERPLARGRVLPREMDSCAASDAERLAQVGAVQEQASAPDGSWASANL